MQTVFSLVLIPCMGVILCIMSQCQRNLTCVGNTMLKIVHVIPTLEESPITLALLLTKDSSLLIDLTRAMKRSTLVALHNILSTHKFVGFSSNILCIGWVRHMAALYVEPSSILSYLSLLVVKHDVVASSSS